MKRTLKIVVTGPFNAGKSELIRTISEIEVVSTERGLTTKEDQIKAETTVAMDFGRTTLGGDTLHLFGTPGQARFEFMWAILAKEMNGFILLVDSTDKNSFTPAKRLIKLFTELATVPFLVGANKQDMADALRPRDIRQLLKLDPDIPVLPLVATDKDSARSVLVQMVQAITWS